MRPTQVKREVYCVTHLLRDLWPIQVQSEVYHVTLLVGTINDPIQIDEARFAGRRKYILIPIIERECVYGSVIHSDEWSAYSNLRAMGKAFYSEPPATLCGSSDRSTHTAIVVGGEGCSSLILITFVGS